LVAVNIAKDFKRLFFLLLTDLGQEISAPKKMEENTDGIIRTKEES
jgi:hypothetical protein